MNQVDSTSNLDALHFSALLHRLARGWSEQDFEMFIACEDKTLQWHIGNYP